MEVLEPTNRGKTFLVGNIQVKLRIVNSQRPGGLANIGYIWPGYDVNITISGVLYARCASLIHRPNSFTRNNFAWSIGGIGDLIKTYNSLNAIDTAPYKPYTYRNADLAFNAIHRYIVSQLSGSTFKP